MAGGVKALSRWLATLDLDLADAGAAMLFVGLWIVVGVGWAFVGIGALFVAPSVLSTVREACAAGQPRRPGG